MDRRETILDKHSEYICDFGLAIGIENARNAMDEYMRLTVLEAFEYVVKNTTGHSIDKNGKVEFKFKGEWIDKEKLFENFL